MIGRESEIKVLKEAFNSGKSEFIAIFGRRRVGKTYPVRETLGNRFSFSYSGIAEVSTKFQLQNFHNALRLHGYSKSRVPTNWIDAFYDLSCYLSSLPEGKKSCFLTNYLGWTLQNQVFCPLLEIFGMGGHQQERIYC